MSVEYLRFNTITNIEYSSGFEQDSFFLSIIFEKNEYFQYIPYFYLKDKSQHNFNSIEEENCILRYINDNNLESIKFLNTFEYLKRKNYNKENLKKLNDNFKFGLWFQISHDPEYVSIQFICNNITLDQIMNRNFFYDYYLGDGIDIEYRKFINSSRYSIGYLLSQNIQNEVNQLKPVLSLQLNNVLYNKDHIQVSIKQTLGSG